MAGIEPQQPHRHRLKLSTFGSQFRLSGPSQLSQSLLSRRSPGPRDGPQCRSLGELWRLLARLQRRRKQHLSFLQESGNRAVKPAQLLIRDREKSEARIAGHGRLRPVLRRTATRHHDEPMREKNSRTRSWCELASDNTSPTLGSPRTTSSKKMTIIFLRVMARILVTVKFRKLAINESWRICKN